VTSLVAENISVRYGRAVVAVDDVTLTVQPGQLVGLIGPNGAGKTSFIDAITGYAKGADGTVRLGDRTLNRLSPHQRARAGLVRTFQNLEIFGDLTVQENLNVALRSSSRGSAESYERGLSLLGRHRDSSRTANSLSQGDRRLLALARAVACQPDILVLDEPAAGLDTHESAELGQRLRRLVEGGLGILLVDHDMSLVLTACDRIVVLDFGAVIAEGDPASIRSDERVRRAYLGV
jgi:ABC-type branched-subunit amino acid transport system ATPase component